MADLLGDGNVKVTWVPADLSSNSNPPAAELNGGTDLQTLITKEGLQIAGEQSPVDNTSLASRDQTEDAGTVLYELNITAKRQQDPAQDTAWNTLTDRALGTLAVRRNQAHEDAYEAGQEVETYPARCGRPIMQPPELNTAQRFIVRLFNHTAGDTRATVS